REDVPEDVKGWITKAIAAMAGGSAAPEETPPAAQQDEDNPMPMQDDEEKPPVYQRGSSKAARVPQPAQQVDDLGAVIQQAVRAAVAPFAGDLDAVKRDQLLERAGGVLTEEQLRWARSQPF